MSNTCFTLPLSFLFVFLLAARPQVYGQDGRWAVGTDAVSWLTGWQNACMAWQPHPELRFITGAGWMGNPQGTGLLPSARPHEFDHAFRGNIGVRLIPEVQSGQRCGGFVGVDFSQERYTQLMDGAQLLLGEPIGESVRREFSRRDILLLAGAQLSMGEAWTLSGHVGVGQSFKKGAQWFGADQRAAYRPAPRMLGIELLRWF
jgi:hypothetical protein